MITSATFKVKITVSDSTFQESMDEAEKIARRYLFEVNLQNDLQMEFVGIERLPDVITTMDLEEIDSAM